MKIQFAYIPKFKPTEPIKHSDPPLPARPKLDPKDPTEVYDLPKFPEEINEIMTDFKKLKSDGTAYLSVEKNGKVFHLYDASRIPFGKMCQYIAKHISGKNKPVYRANKEQNIGDRCVVINALNIRLTGKKVQQKVHRYHTGYIGHLREIPFERMIKTKPEQLISWCVWKMLPKNKHRMQHLENLDIFRTREHNYFNILPQILPRPTFSQYHGNLYEDFKSKEGELIYSKNPVDSPEVQAEIKGMKVNIQEDNEIFTPFSERKEKLVPVIQKKEMEKITRKYLKIKKRYRQYWAKEPKQKDYVYNPEKSYLLTSERDVRYYKLQKKVPQDEDPEIEEELEK